MGSLSGNLCPEGSLSIGFSVQGVFVQGESVEGVSVQRVSVQGSLFKGSLCQGDPCWTGPPPGMVNSGRYTSYWNVFLFLSINF